MLFVLIQLYLVESNQLEENNLSKEVIHEGMHVMISQKILSKKPHIVLMICRPPLIEITNLISFYGVKSLTEHLEMSLLQIISLRNLLHMQELHP